MFKKSLTPHLENISQPNIGMFLFFKRSIIWFRKISIKIGCVEFCLKTEWTELNPAYGEDLLVHFEKSTNINTEFSSLYIPELDFYACY